MAEIDNFRLQRLPSREGEKLLDQPRATFGRHGHHIDALERLRILPTARCRRRVRADDDSQEIIEIMRNPARHMAERLKLLRLAQRFLGLPLLGPVEQSRDGASVFGRTMKNLDRSPIFLVLDTAPACQFA